MEEVEGLARDCEDADKGAVGEDARSRNPRTDAASGVHGGNREDVVAALET